MSRCEGLHCPGCRDGGGKVALVGLGILVVVVEVVEWIAGHVWELLAVTTVCGALVIAAVVALFKWADRRDARHGAEKPFLVVREAPAAVNSAERPALGFRDLHIHLDGAPTTEQAQVIRQALNGRTSQS